MGNSGSRQQSPATPNVKTNKDHKRDKTFRVGLSFGKGDLSAEGHFQMGYVSKTKKVYAVVRPSVDGGAGVDKPSPATDRREERTPSSAIPEVPEDSVGPEPSLEGPSPATPTATTEVALVSDERSQSNENF